MKQSIVGLFSAGFWLAAFGAASAQDAYEYGSSYKTATVLPANVITGSHYKIRDTVQSDGFMFTYTVESDYGTYQVTGDYALQRSAGPRRSPTRSFMPPSRRFGSARV